MAKIKLDTFDEVVGVKVRSMRRAKDMSQRSLGLKLGVSFQQIQKYENGTNRLRLGDFVKLCNALGLKPWAVLAEVIAAVR